MTSRRVRLSVLTLSTWFVASLANVAIADLMSQSAIDRLGAQRYWQVDLTLEGGESVSRATLLDDNLYVFTDANRVYAVHALTGVIRWSHLIADPEQTVRGPSHNDNYVFFTTGGTVTVLNRRSGDAAADPRSLDGVVIEVQHDTATISKGSDHGVRPKDVFKVFHVSEYGEPTGEPIADLVIDTIRNRTSRGQLISRDSLMKAESGDHVVTEIELPLERVKLPFAASCAAVADDQRIYVGAANQRFYSLDIIGGYRNWQLMAPGTVSAKPVLRGPDLYFAGQDGGVVSCTKADRVKNWTFETEAPIFADPVVTDDRVFAASTDRSLYCLDRTSGKRIWRVRFDAPLNQSPAVSEGRVFQTVPGQGLVVLDLKTGDQLWQRAEGGQFLAQFEDDVLLYSGEGTRQLVRLEAKSGKVKDLSDLPDAQFAAADRESQAILLASPRGNLICLRSKKAPYLKPEQLAEVLRSDFKMKIAARMDAQRKAEAEASVVAPVEEKPRLPEWLMEDDFLSSRNTAKPVGGRSLVDTGEPAAKETDAAEPGVSGVDDDEVDEDEAGLDDDEVDEDEAGVDDDELDEDEAGVEDEDSDDEELEDDDSDSEDDDSEDDDSEDDDSEDDDSDSEDE